MANEEQTIDSESREAQTAAQRPNPEFPDSGPLREVAPLPHTQEMTVDSDGVELRPPALPYPVVAIGASAGGLNAFREILENLPVQTGMSFVLVTHLAPQQKSYLAEIMERFTAMPVLAIEGEQRPLPDQVYVLQPNQLVRLQGGLFHLQERAETDKSPRTIDIFFQSVALDQKNFCVGVVLSGAAGDGAEGMKAIKGEGGITVVQSPESAVQSGMPRSSIAADHVDVVLPPAELALELGRIAQQFLRPELRPLENGKAPEGEDHAFERILRLLRNLSGLELTQYKPETLRRRMARRMILLRLSTLSDYHRLLQTRGDELRALQEDMLISVTRFFRDTEFWDVLQTTVLPALFQDRPAGKPIRVWCAGCATGEEAYSFAIALQEFVSLNGLDAPVQIFGTDASEHSIERARNAIYPETSMMEISPERQQRFFVKSERGFQVAKRVRDTCIFAKQNLCNDPPFSHIDILSCRNVMIYFNPVLQRQIMSTFHYALEPGGYLLLGMSEGLRDFGEAFVTVDRKRKIYTKTGSSLAAGYEATRSYRASAANPSGRPLADNEATSWAELELQRAADRMVLARFGPPGLIVDDRMHVLQARGQTTPLIQLSPGAVSWHLVRVLREDIAKVVERAVQRSIEENIPVAITLEASRGEQTEQHFHVDVLPITHAGPRPRCFLILFQGIEKNPPEAKSQPAPALGADAKEHLVAQLRHDLSTTRFYLQSLTEERDGRNQELTSANEEIQSANEELQSTNEELETTKEELQSANEELQTVNDELQQRNSTLAQTGNDLSNLLTSVNIPLLMLSSDLRIRQFTPPMQKVLSVLPSDLGRPIGDIRLHLSVENLEPLLTEVMETLGTHESEVQDRDGRWYLLRVRPYRTSENRIEGLVLVLVDIDQLRRSQQGLLDARDFARSVVECVPVAVVVLNFDCTIRTVNTAFRELTGMQTNEVNGRSLPDLFQQLWGPNDLRERLAELEHSEIGTQIIFEHETANADSRILSIKGHLISNDGHRVILLVMEDITIRRQAERSLSQQTVLLEGEIATAARTLDRTKEELRGLTGHLFTVQEEERQRVARELHDDIGQRLSFLELLLNDIPPEQPLGGSVEKMQQARKQIQTLSTDVREISHRLHPAILDDLGLSVALRALVDEFGKREEMPATYISRNLPELAPQPATTAVYRITQEALRNVAKHAGITHVKVLLEAKDGSLHLEIRDFGIGFDQETEGDRQGLGIISMKERARLAHGILSVQSALGQGTTVAADLPLQSPHIPASTAPPRAP